MINIATVLTLINEVLKMENEGANIWLLIFLWSPVLIFAIAYFIKAIRWW